MEAFHSFLRSPSSLITITAALVPEAGGRMLHPVSAAATTVHSAARPRGARSQDAAPRTAHRARTSAPQPANCPREARPQDGAPQHRAPPAQGAPVHGTPTHGRGGGPPSQAAMPRARGAAARGCARASAGGKTRRAGKRGRADAAGGARTWKGSGGVHLAGRGARAGAWRLSAAPLRSPVQLRLVTARHS